MTAVWFLLALCFLDVLLLKIVVGRHNKRSLALHEESARALDALRAAVASLEASRIVDGQRLRALEGRQRCDQIH